MTTKKGPLPGFLPLALVFILAFLSASCEMLADNQSRNAPLAGGLYENGVLKLDLTPVAAVAAEACCTHPSDSPVRIAANIIDGDTTTRWRADKSTDDGNFAHGFRGHYINIDLGAVYHNITRLEYLPDWFTDDGSQDGYSMNRNGVCREFAIYITENKPGPGEYAPESALAAKGEWISPHAAHGGTRGATNQLYDFSAWKTATFNSVSGRYVQFRFVSAYYDHWSTNNRRRASAMEIRLFTAARPFHPETTALVRIMDEVETFRSLYPKHYGYNNAQFDKWLSRGEEYLISGTQEGIDELTDRLGDIYRRYTVLGTYTSFTPKQIWADDKGNHLQAHGGGVLDNTKVDGKYYFYGEDRTPTSWAPMPGVHCYSSTDLYNWKDEGVVLPVFNNTVYSRTEAGVGAWGATEWDQFIWKSRYSSPEDFVYSRTDGKAVAFDPDYDYRKYLPEGNPPLYVEGPDAKPHPGNLGLDSAKIAVFNALYADLSVLEKKQLYRYWNFQSINERPKVIYNEKYDHYVLWTHIEAGDFDNNYGTARAAVAVSKKPTGPFKLIWAYRVHYTPGTGHGDSGIGMSRDQTLLKDNVDSAKGDAWGNTEAWASLEWAGTEDLNGYGKGADGVNDAYQITSSVGNATMCINLLDDTFTRPLGIPYKAAADRGEQYPTAEGWLNRPGVDFNWTTVSQSRESPAVVIHYQDGVSTYETPDAPAAQKRYYSVHSGTTGWFANTQRQSRTIAGAPILGYPRNITTGSTGWVSASGTGGTGNGWQNSGNWGSYVGPDPVRANPSGVAEDGSVAGQAFDGQTTYVLQLRYPAYDADGNPEARQGELVPGKYIWMADKWEPVIGLYDSRYIWLPMKILPEAGGGYARVAWMTEWRWEDFVYDTGPFAAPNILFD
jgi:hypothetical protein